MSELTFGVQKEEKRSWRVFAASYGLQILATVVLIELSIFTPVKIMSKHYDYIALSAPTDTTPVPKAKPAPRIVRSVRHIEPPKTPAPVFETAKLRVPQDLHQQVKSVAPPKVVVNQFVPAALTNSVPTAPKAPVSTGSFSSGSSAQATLKAKAEQVQTGGFGDPNGVPASNNGRDGSLTIAKVGSFDLPSGPGYGNGTGGSRGMRGAVASAGFGNGTATQNPQMTRGAIQQGGFGDTRVANDGPRVRAAEIAPTMTPVEILQKPKPIYTEEARQLKLEGEVLLEVLFTADGQVRPLRVVRGLGHGLDEAAQRAATQIRFKPAQRDGRPVDSTAVLHVVFQIA
jgi:TonB family protein